MIGFVIGIAVGAVGCAVGLMWLLRDLFNFPWE